MALDNELLKICFVSAEAAPFAKVGGLADVAGSLPIALKNLGHDIRLIMPKYKKIDDGKFGLQPILEPFYIPSGSGFLKVVIKQGRIGKDVPVYFVDSPELFSGRDEIYGAQDDLERFALFCRAVFEVSRLLGWRPDIIHLNDWQTALAAVYLKTVLKTDSFFKGTGSVYTIHNLAYHGLYAPEKLLDPMGLTWDEFDIERMEFFGKVNLMKGGIVYADAVNTVSETYALEIQTKEYGAGLDGLLKSRKYKLFGILNGIDYDVFNPETDPLIPSHFSIGNRAGKSACKKKLLKELRIRVPSGNKRIPLFGIISRLVEQKGFDILTEIIEDVLDSGALLALLGTGDPVYHEYFEELAEKYPAQTGINLKFDTGLAQRIYAGSDMFLMPSQFEPCGLGQIISLRYGTVPIVRATGGLADTIEDFDPKKLSGNGFVFEEYESDALLETIKRAMSAYKEPKLWESIVTNAMTSDFSWKASAAKYAGMYRSALKANLGTP